MSVDWEALFTDKSVDECWRTLRNKLEELCKEHIPQSSPKKNSRNKIWMNDAALCKVKKNHHSWKRFLLSKQGEEYQEFARIVSDCDFDVKGLIANAERYAHVDQVKELLPVVELH